MLTARKSRQPSSADDRERVQDHAAGPAAMKLSLVAIDKEGFIRCATDGNITAAAFDGDTSGKALMEATLGQTWSANKVVLDMSKTNYIDSTAVGWLISANKQFKANGGQFVIHSVQPAVRQVLDLLKIGKVVPIVDDEAAARALVTGAAR
jgi:anti-anti-sigma factor